MPCNCAKQLPGAARLAGNAVRAAGRIIVAAATSKPVKVEQATFEERLVICRACPSCYRHKDEVSLRCTECGCWLNGKHFAKASLATEKCPLKKWGET